MHGETVYILKYHMLNIGRYENMSFTHLYFDKTKHLYSHENWTSNDVMSNDVITFCLIDDVIKFWLTCGNS
jgi:hypothetical protein